MKKTLLLLLNLLGILAISFTQTNPNFRTCSFEDTQAHMLQYNPDALEELAANEAFIKARVAKIQQDRLRGKLGNTTYTIPVVIHVYHNGDDGLLDMEQIQSGLDIINTDIKGLNDDWNMIDPAFDAIKASLDIELCLATIDPEGNPTTGVNYYDNEAAMLNNENLYLYGWDNYKYLNIYLPKYTNGGPSLFTAYANYPSTAISNSGASGITYSSIRWGYGTHSELDDGQEWASVGTHEMGHWLDLRHTFENGCSTVGDGVDDTPPTSGTGLELEGCYNNDFSCGVATNGSNYMDYNIDCKKMFTQGQVDRMTAALDHPARVTIWSDENLIATGCAEAVSTTTLAEANSVRVSPNPVSDMVRFTFDQQPQQLLIYDVQGRVVDAIRYEVGGLDISQTSVDVSDIPAGMYFYRALWENNQQSGRFCVE